MLGFFIYRQVPSRAGKTRKFTGFQVDNLFFSIVIKTHIKPCTANNGYIANFIGISGRKQGSRRIIQQGYRPDKRVSATLQGFGQQLIHILSLNS